MLKMFLITNIYLISGFLSIILKIKANPIKNGSEIFYDQRQSGKYNIHVNIKDVAIIALDQNSFKDVGIDSEDYYYDDSDFTVKPLSAWLQGLKPSTTQQNNILGTNQSKPPSTVSVIHTQNTKITTIEPKNTTIPPPPPIKKSSIIVLNKPTETIIPPIRSSTPTNIVKPFISEIPVQIIMEPILEPQLNKTNNLIRKFSTNDVTKSNLQYNFDDSRVVHLNRRPNLQFKKASCPTGQILDKNGVCRVLKSSILGRILSALTSVPFKEDSFHNID